MIESFLEYIEESAAIALLVTAARQVEFECRNCIGDSFQFFRVHGRFRPGDP